jgi:hypothetical protein
MDRDCLECHKPKTASLLQFKYEAHSTAMEARLTEEVPLSEDGYRVIAALGNPEDMELFAWRTAQSMGLRIADRAVLLQHVAKLFGTKPASFALLKAEILGGTQDGASSWVVPADHVDGYKAMSAVQTGAAVTLYGQAITGAVAGQETSLGNHASLDESGYRSVVALKSNSDMETFMRRTLSSLALKITNEQSFKASVPWFSGETASSSFGNLKGKILNLLGMPNSWVVDPLQPPPPGDGKEAPVTDEGYAAVAALNNNEQMCFFIEKVVKQLGLVIVNYGGVQGLAPFYSGDQMVQTLSNLKVEIFKASRTPGSWVQPVQKTKGFVAEGTAA